MARHNVTLQVSLAPPDVGHAVHIVPHQLRTLGAQVDEVVLVLDTKKSRVKQFATGWDDGTLEMTSFLHEVAAEHRNVRVVTVDYSRKVMRQVAASFFGRSSLPAKDIRGGPFYAYFFGLAAAQNDYVFHLDSDMLLGGASETWISEALAVLDHRSDVLAVCPLPGPPAPDGLLRDQEAYSPQREAPFTFRFRHYTSRLFLCDRTRLAGPDRRIPLLREVSPLVRVKCSLFGQSSYALPERLITVMMQRHGLSRIDILGQPPGLWAVHPAARTRQFHAGLADIVSRVESSDVTAAQLGRYDLHPSMIPPEVSAAVKNHA